MKLNVALTGNFGSGKTTALHFFNLLGCVTRNIDDLCHEIYEYDNYIIKRIVEQFGSSIISGSGKIDKQKLSDLVFDSDTNLTKLTDIIHPVLKGKVLDYINSNVDHINVFEIPLLFESQIEKYFDCTISVWTFRRLRYERLLKVGWSTDQIDMRLKFQMNDDTKLEMSDYGLINNWDENNLFSQCIILYNELVIKAQQIGNKNNQ